MGKCRLGPMGRLGKAMALLSRRRSQSSHGNGKRSRSMLELMFCSLLTIVPDYLFRRYAQGKRFGKEITFFSVWFELRWGITACVTLTVCLITVIFYHHPSTTNATLYFRAVQIPPETNQTAAKNE